MINEWPVAFPYSVPLAGVAPDKENISCEYLCCLFKAKAQCLHKVIRLYTRTERHTSAEREGRRETCEYQLSSNPHLCHMHAPSPFFPPRFPPASLPPYKQFSSLVMPLLILYGQTFPSLPLPPYGPERRRGSRVKI